jgi:hypothetical protein
MTAPTSTYPRPVEELLPEAAEYATEHAAEFGGLPSRNKLMDRFQIGATKANKLLALLAVLRSTTGGSGTATLDDEPGFAETFPDEPATDPTPESIAQAAVDTDPEPKITPVAVERTRHKPVTWPVALLSLPAMVAIWSGWVSLGGLAGFGPVHPLPGIADDVSINSAITLPIGMETYAAYALWVWLSGRAPRPARRFARWSALVALGVGAAGQTAYHLMVAAGMTAAPWWITTAVSCLPVAVLGMGAALAHLQHVDE